MEQHWNTYGKSNVSAALIQGIVDGTPVVLVDNKKQNLVIRPCCDPGDGEDCYSVFQLGTDYCVSPHMTYAEAYRSVYGDWPPDEDTCEL